MSFSGPRSWKLGDFCSLVAWSALSCCSSENQRLQSMGGCLPPAARLYASAFQPPTCPRPGCIPASHQRFLALPRGPWALAGDLSARHGRGFDASTLLLWCLRKNCDAASRTAFHLIIQKHFFSSTLILASDTLHAPVIHSS